MSPEKRVFQILSGGSSSESLSIREYFAGLALQGILTGEWARVRNPVDPIIEPKDAAKLALDYANALVAILP